MKKTIKATNIELSTAIDSYTDKLVSTVEKFLDGYDDNAIVNIEVGRTTQHHKSGDIFRAEVTVHSILGVMRSVSEKSDLYAAIDEVKDELSNILRSKKTKKKDIVRRSGLAMKNMVRDIYGKGKGTWRSWTKR